jgi:WD40 repeat protein
VDGSRCWGNDTRDKIYKVEWSPDGSILLFASEKNNIFVFNSTGFQIGEIEIPSELKTTKVVAIHWWNNVFSEGFKASSLKHLCVAFLNGMIFLYNDHTDTQPIKFKTDYKEVVNVEWNHHGDILAVGGIFQDQLDTKNSINFYNVDLKLIKTLKVFF